ncbi:MAG: hypothetical protein OEZ68_16545 [Gammaproteobacteria bacterium]|nr:hypothetical protein [Gammaproteobacteria bacterium]MDH5802412.1 hypothetical protein [Gammaproteobacteria bacterium]
MCRLSRKFSLLLSATLLFSGCAGISQQAPAPEHFAAPLALPDIDRLLQYVRGQVVDRNGNPVASATVFIPKPKSKSSKKKTLSDYQLGSISIASGACRKPQQAFYSYTCTDADGRFHLQILGSVSLPLQLSIDRGQHATSILLSLDDLSTDLGRLTLQNPELTRNKIAIVMDLFNPFEHISRQGDHSPFQDPHLVRRFFDYYQLNEYEHELLFPTLSSLFSDSNGDNKADIHQYKTIYLNSRGEEDMRKLSKREKAILLEYVSNGGELRITNWGSHETWLNRFI